MADERDGSSGDSSSPKATDLDAGRIPQCELVVKFTFTLRKYTGLRRPEICCKDV
ncbi:MAG: hypothetical protein ABUK01_07690 [Leptospirales bacterium]